MSTKPGQLQGLKVPQKQPAPGRRWLTDGSCIRLRPEHKATCVQLGEPAYTLDDEAKALLS